MVGRRTIVLANLDLIAQPPCHYQVTEVDGLGFLALTHPAVSGGAGLSKCLAARSALGLRGLRPQTSLAAIEVQLLQIGNATITAVM